MTTLVKPDDERIRPLRQIPFIVVHLMPLAAFYTGTRWIDWVVCLALYYVRMFAITAGYHRYFSHKTYKMGRVTQFLMAFLGSSSAQKGVLWWAANHRHHHRYSDMPEDVHTPKRGFWWSHVGWMLVPKFDATQWDRIKDFAKFPELRWLNKHWYVPPTLLGVTVFLVGGWSMLLIGFFLSTVLLWHGTFTINSLSHVFGKRRYATTDTSRNNWLLALITCGEGWHNNHHHFCASANQGFYWWEIDVSYYIIKLMEKLGLAWDVRTPSEAALERNRLDRPNPPVDVGLHPERAPAPTPSLGLPNLSLPSLPALPKLPLAPAALQDAEQHLAATVVTRQTPAYARATGKATAESDWDVLVVVPDDAPDDDVDLVKAWRRLRDVRLCNVEVFPVRHREFEAARLSLGTLAQRVWDEGRVIYGD